MAKIISLASQKGGVGKSVSAVNLAYAFAIGGYKILLIDFDSQGSVRTSLGIQDSKAMGTKELLTKSHIPLEKLISKLREQNNLDVICSNIRHPSEEKTIFQICNKYDVLARSLKNKVQNYDFVILDAPASTNSLVINVLYASDYIMAIEMYKKVDNEESLVSILINLIDFWNKKDNFQQALFYAKIAEAIVEKKKYSTSGLLYQKLAQLYNQQMFATKSIQYYTKAIETFAQLDDSNKSLCLYEKGLVFKSIFQFAHALDCLQGGLTIFIALKNNAYILKTLEQIRKIFLSQGETSKAKEIESKIVKLGQEAL